MSSTFSQFATKLEAPNSNPSETDLKQWSIKPGQASGTNVLGLVTISIITGIFIGALKRDTRPLLLQFFNDLSELTLRITSYVIWLTPIGVVSCRMG